MKYLCKRYKDRPEWCRDYPWSESYDKSDYHDDCQFYDAENEKLIPKEEVQKTTKEMEDFCVSCGKCCYYWEKKKAIFPCSALQVTETG